MQRWTIEQANKWHQSQPWLIGCNFISSTAINQIEMWQAETFDPDTISRELSWAARLGFNTVRVYLHDLVWKADASGFRRRIDHFLDLAAQRGIRTLFVIFDDCWHDDPRLGRQPDPVPGLHNSGWVQSLGSRIVSDPAQWDGLKMYVQDILTTFRHDPRILMWDLYNEVGNNYLPNQSRQDWLKSLRAFNLWARRRLLPNRSLGLLKAAFEWAWEVRPAQPLTSSVWRTDMAELNGYVVAVSDIISFHNYQDAANLEAQITSLKAHNRPLICTEYMARTRGSRFETHLPIFKRERIGCINWGLVSGKTQTIFSWQDSLGGSEPAVWFHDIFRADGIPYSDDEVAFIRQMTRTLG